MEKSITNIVVNNFYNRFSQAKSMGDIIKEKTEKIKVLVEDVKTQSRENPEKTAKDFQKQLSDFKREEISSTLLQQQMQSLLTRALEYYKVLQATGTEINISEEDKKFLEKISSSVDLYGVEKGKLIVLDTNYHQAIMDSVSQMSDNIRQSIFNHIISS